MLKPLYLLAALPDLDGIRPNSPVGGAASGWSDTMIILAAVLGLVILIVLWAVFIRKRSDRRYNTLKVPSRRDLEQGAEQSGHRRRRRHRHKERRGRNPSLAEAGGLPPVRADQTPPSKT